MMFVFRYCEISTLFGDLIWTPEPWSTTDYK